MSQPPEYPGRRRLKRAAAAAGSEAYQGAFEAIGSVLVAGAIGYWVDWRWATAPFGLLVGIVIGFAAMVLRLVRLGRELDPASTESNAEAGRASEGWTGDDRGIGEVPGLSRILLDEREKEKEENRSGQKRREPGEHEREHEGYEEGIEPDQGRRDEDERT